MPFAERRGTVSYTHLNSNFIYFESKLGKGLNVSIYYSYLKEVPSDYKLYIDDYEIEVDWRELLENR